MNQFDWKYYLHKNPDIEMSGIKTQQEAYTHYQLYGQFENRMARNINNELELSRETKAESKNKAKLQNINWKQYLERYPDLQSIGITTEDEAATHYKLYGHYEHRVIHDITDKKGYKEISYVSDMFNLNTANHLINTKKSIKEKIYLLIWTQNTETLEESLTKGINIDSILIYNQLKQLNIDAEFMYISFHYLTNFDKNMNPIKLDREIYIFPEIVNSELYDFLFENNKTVITVPNMDSYSTFKKIKIDRETDFLNLLQQYKNCSNYFIWCKTKQTYEWLQEHSIDNIQYIHWYYNIYDNIYESIDTVDDDDDISNILKQNKNYLLLDTGNSLTRRKYFEEILDIFMNQQSLPYSLLVKTTPTVYNKFIANTKYEEKFNNITFINKIVNIKELNNIYSKVKYFIYISKYDGYSLALANAMRYNLFIFCLNGYPYKEFLYNYPRKCLINCHQDFTNCMGVAKPGKALSQIYYKADLTDLRNKLNTDIEIHEKIIDTTISECDFFNNFNNNVFSSNLYNFFQINFGDDSYYNNSNVGLTSFAERGIILIENIQNIICQTGTIYLYLNSYNNKMMNYLNKISNIKIIDFIKDYKAISKMLTVQYFTKDFNFIIDDDIIYPNDYISYSCDLLTKKENHVYSYNGYDEYFKYSFVNKFKESSSSNCLIGSGTIFYRNDAICKLNLIKYLNEKVLNDYHRNNNIGCFADKICHEYFCKNDIKSIILSPKLYKWMINNSKILLNKTPGLFEYKKEKKLLNEIQLKGSIDKNISFYIIKDNLNNKKSLINRLSSYVFVKDGIKEYDFMISNDNLIVNNEVLIHSVNIDDVINYMNNNILKQQIVSDE